MIRPALVLLILVLATPAVAEELPKAERAALGDVAKRWGSLARWCAKRKLGSEARFCVARASEALPEDPSLKTLADALAKVPDGGRASTRAQWERRRGKVVRKVAPLYEGLATSKGVPPQRALIYLERAQALAPSEERGEQLERLRELASVDTLLLRRASGHAMEYYVSLPRGWTPDAERRWPVLVCVDGAGSNFEGIARGYLKRRGDAPFIIVSPCSFSNTNAIQGGLKKKYLTLYDEETIAAAGQDRFGWDEAGLLAVLSDLRARSGAEERIYITGFSGGGNLTYRMVFKHPDLIGGAAPACANYLPKGYLRDDTQNQFDTAARTFPIRLITGADDPHRELTFGKEGQPGIEPQTDWVVRDLDALGYPHVKRTLMPGLKHSPAHDLVLETLGPYMRGERTRSDPLP